MVGCYIHDSKYDKLLSKTQHQVFILCNKPRNAHQYYVLSLSIHRHVSVASAVIMMSYKNINHIQIFVQSVLLFVLNV